MNFSDIVKKLGLLPSLVKQLKKTAESKKTAQEVEAKLQTALKPKETPTSLPSSLYNLVKPIIEPIIKPPLETERPGYGIAQPRSQLEKVFEAQQKLGKVVEEKTKGVVDKIVGTPESRMIMVSRASKIMNLIEVELGAIATGQATPLSNETFQEYLDRLPYLGQVVEDKLKEKGIVTNPYALKAINLAIGLAIPNLPGGEWAKTAKIAPDVLTALSAKYAPDVVEQIVAKGGKELAEKALKEGGETFIQKAGIEITPKVSGVPEVPKELQPLAQEAKKYGSAEEFVNSQQRVFRGGEVLDIKQIGDRGIPVSTDRKVAETFLKAKEDFRKSLPFLELPKVSLEESFLSKSAKIATRKDIPTDIFNAYKAANPVMKPEIAEPIIGKWAKANGFDAIDYRTLGKTSMKEAEIKVLNPNVLKTKFQLTDFYNQAVKGVKAEVPAKPLITPPKKGFEWKERGFITSVKEELPELKVAGQYVPRSTDRLAIKARNLIKEDITTAEKMARVGVDDDSVAVGAELLKHYSDEAAKITDLATKNALYEKAADLAHTMAKKLTEQGRSVQAASILGRLTPEGQLKFAAREIQKYNELVEATRGGLGGLKKKIPELTKEQTKFIETEMKIIQGMAEGTEKAMRFYKLQNYITDLIPTPLFKKMIAVWKAGLLTGIKTTGLNIFANVSHFGTEVVKDIPATMIDRVISLFTGKRAVGFSLEGVPSGIKEGLDKSWQYLTTGFDTRNIGVKLDYRRISFGKGKIAHALQAYTDSVFRLMGAEDQPFYYAAKIRSLYEQAKVAAINKGLRGEKAQKFVDELIQNPTEQMVKYASTDAEIAVFQNKTLLGEAGRAIQRVGGGVGEIVVPFARTPSAVATQILNYSPVGIVKTIAENIGRGKFDQRLFAQGLGRGMTGTAVLYLGTLLYKQGLLALNKPQGEREQKLWELEGKKANSIYDPITKKWRTIQVLGPAGNLLLIGGQFQKAFDESGSPSEAIAVGLSNSSLSFTQQTFLTGVSNFIDAVSDPARSAEYVAGTTLSSAVPTIIADVARATDTVERRANEIFEKLQARIPGIREGLEPQVTVLGEELETIGNPLELMADPTRPSSVKITPVNQELRRLWDAGFHVSPTLLGDKEGYDALTKKQNTELWKRAGEITNTKLTSLFQKEEYKDLPDDQKAKNVESVTEKSKLVARVEMAIKLTEGLEDETLKSKLSELKESGLLTREVFDIFVELR